MTLSILGSASRQAGIDHRGLHRTIRALGVLAIIVILMCQGQVSQALISFSIKYHLPCEQCHNMVPRLNPYGYAFYRAGS